MGRIFTVSELGRMVDLEKCQVQGRQHIDFDPSPFDPIRPKLFDQKGRPNSFRPISFDPFHAIL